MARQPVPILKARLPFGRNPQDYKIALGYFLFAERKEARFSVMKPRWCDFAVEVAPLGESRKTLKAALGRKPGIHCRDGSSIRSTTEPDSYTRISNQLAPHIKQVKLVGPFVAHRSDSNPTQWWPTISTRELLPRCQPHQSLNQNTETADMHRLVPLIVAFLSSTLINDKFCDSLSQSGNCL
jgi:hypothetical protein